MIKTLLTVLALIPVLMAIDLEKDKIGQKMAIETQQKQHMRQIIDECNACYRKPAF